MKRSKFNFKRKLIPFIIALALAFAVFTVGAFAEEPGSPNSSEGSGTEADSGDVGSDDSVKPENIFFSSLLEDLKEFLPEILSALSLICSVILMFVYKSGFIPMVKEGVSALSSRVKAIGDEADKMAIGGKETAEAVKAGLDFLEKRLTDMESSLGALSKSLGDIDGLKERSDKETRVLSLEVEMLYELFMSSALPQYVKDRVGEKIAEMRLSLEGGEG